MTIHGKHTFILVQKEIPQIISLSGAMTSSVIHDNETVKL